MQDLTGSRAPIASIVIASYNMGQFIGEAIRSVLSQTLADLEVIVVDDGSTDSTAEVLNTFRSDPRVVILRQSRCGQPRAKNAGAHASRGTYIGFCDADDLWMPDKLERQVPLLDNDSSVAVAYARSREISVTGSLTDRISPRGPSGYLVDALFRDNFVPFGTCLVRAECFRRAGGFDESLSMGIDWDLWLRLSVNWRFSFLDGVTYLYRVWDGQMSKNWRGRYEHAFRIMRKFERENHGAISRATVRAGYADTYVNYGRAMYESGQGRWPAFVALLHGIGLAPASVVAWKSLAKLALPRHDS